jgi:hypothetical protein
MKFGIKWMAALGWLLWQFWRLARPWVWRYAGAAGPDGGAGPPLNCALAVGALGSMVDFVAHGLVDNSYFLPDMAVIFWLTLAVAATLERPLSR